jgi:poly-gamma-glutamate capsule biosynthesis protein CapA/YwtB (metallophosphatase superfamily)
MTRPGALRRSIAAAVLLMLAPACTATPSAAPGHPSSTAPASTPTHSAAPSSSPSPATSPSTAAAKPRTLTVVMSGDVLLHQGLWYTAQNDARRTGRGVMDFRPLLAGMRPVIRGADLAICHLETPLAPRGGPYSGYPVFSVPPQIVPALKWEGYDACTTASNHSLDDGYAGIVRTLHFLDAAGIAHFGTATSAREARRPLILEANGVRVGLIEATYGTNGIPIPAAEPWSVPLINVRQILAKAHRAKRMGADIVIVALHWGTEYQHATTPAQVRIARRLLASPAVNLVYGHHVHVVQPFNKISGKWVAYGLGNAVAQQDLVPPGLYDGVTARFTFTEQPSGRFTVTKAEYIPTYTTHVDWANPRMRWLDIATALHSPKTSPALRAQLLAARARIRHNVNLDGALAKGLRAGH